MEETDPQKIMSQGLQATIDSMFQKGELRVQQTVGLPTAPGGEAPAPRPGINQDWSPDAFDSFISKNRATTPQFMGSNPPGAQSVLELAKTTISGSEGFYGKAYYGSKNPNRQPGNIAVRPGTFDDSAPSQKENEVSIGYGFNMNAHKDWRQTFSGLFGFTADDNNAIANGQKELTQAQAAQLRDHSIMQFTADVQHMTQGATLKDGEQAALISLAYNAGPGNLRKSGIPQAIVAGEKPEQIAQRIRAFNTLGGQLQNRRNHEAMLYLGAQSEKFFDNSTNRLPVVASADLNPQERH
jgi:GH24 family phage-related lysozyme (muramidase)